MPFGIKDYHKDLTTLHIGTENPHAYFIPYSAPMGIERPQRDYSKYFKPLTGAWNFKFYPSIIEVPDPRENNIEFSEKMLVPSNWQYEIGRGYDVPQYTNVDYPFPIDPPHVPEVNPAAVYKREFTLNSSEIESKDVMLHFEGVDSAFYLFLNGEFIGYSQVSHATSEFKITDKVKSGINEICLVVLKWCTGSYIEDQDMYRASGIFREVYLLMRDKARIEDIYLHAEPSTDFKSARVSVELSVNAPLTVAYKLLDAEGKILADGSNAIGEGATAVDIATITEPKLWSDETPYLYTLELSAGSEVINLSVGVRRIEIRQGVVFINGRKVKAKGVNRHDSHPILGHATPMEHMIRDIMIMKAHNVNMVRTSHYPNDPRFYELCDEYGIFVCDEADLECHGINIYRDKNELTDGEEWAESYLDRAVRMLERDKNHPSIIMWSVGNESGAGENHRIMVDYFRSRDHERMIHSQDESYHAFINEEKIKNGENGLRSPEYYRAMIDVESRMYITLDELENYYLKPKRMTKPFFHCEYCHAMGNGPGDIGPYNELLYKYDKYFGGCVWEFTDHSVAIGEYRHADPKFVYGGDMGEFPHFSNFCVDGLVYPDRRLHTGLYELREAYAPFHISYQNGRLAVKNLRRFTSLSDLTIYYTVEKNGKITASGTLGEANIAPERSRSYNLPVECGEFTTLNISLRQNRKTEWADIGYEVGKRQFIISDTLSVSNAPAGGARLTEDGVSYKVSFGETEVTVSKNRGLITSIKDNGCELITSPVTPTIWRAPTDNDRRIKRQWTSHCFDRAELNCKKIEASEYSDRVEISTEFTLSAPALLPIMTFKTVYTFSEGRGIGVSTSAKVREGLPPLPRFGFILDMPEGAENIRYFGYGPHEAYEDKRLASYIGLFKTTATENFEHYIRPQENMSHYGCKWADVTHTYGHGLYFSASSFSFSASHYTPMDLTVTAHDYELKPNKETTVIIDYRNAGIGSNSCGPELDPKYAISDSEIEFSFNIKPLFTGNRCPFGEYVK